MLLLVNFPCSSHVLRYDLPIKFTFSCLGLHPITCQFLLDSLHLIMYSTQMGQSTDRQLPNKEPMLLCFEIWYFSHHFSALMLFIFANNYSDTSGNRPSNVSLSLFLINWKVLFFCSPFNNIFIRIFHRSILFFFYKNAKISCLVSHFDPPIKKKKKYSCMHSMPMF